jgi:GNAT superfamily N-acetyltransferase
MITTVLKPGNRGLFRNLISDRIWARLDEPEVFSLGAVTEDGVVVGTLCAELGPDSADIIWLYIAESHRGRGLGTQLLETFFSGLAADADTKEVFLFFPDHTDYEDLFYFLCMAGFLVEPISADGVYSVKVKKLTDSKLLQRPGTAAGAMFLKAVPDIYLKIFNSLRRPQDALVEFPLDKNEYLPCSMAYIRDNEIRGLLLFTREGRGRDANMVYAWSRKGEKNAAGAMLVGAGKAMARLLPPDASIHFATLNEVSRAIARMLDPAADSLGILVAHRHIGSQTEG